MSSPRVRRVLSIGLLLVLGWASSVLAARPAKTPRAAAASQAQNAAAPGLPVAPTAIADTDPAVGEKAVVRTVFQGTRVEEFDAEIVGVLHGGRAGGDIILARATSDRVTKSGIAQGMSGSPVYVGGRLIGALSSGWQFSREPLFGITPIREMLPLLDRRGIDPAGVSGGPSGADLPGMSAGVSFGAFRWSDLDESDAATPPTGVAAGRSASGLEPLAIPLACAGLNPAALDWARPQLAPLGLAAVPGGQASARSGGPPALEPGSAVAVDVLRGDLQFAAIGTATWVKDGRVLAFGHPFFQSGDVRLPLATAEIATIVASDAVSFKLGVRGETVGAIEQDRRAGIAGSLGPSPRLLPFSVAIRGAGTAPQRFRFETVEDRNLAPTLIAIATLNSVLESGGTGGNQTLRWTVTLHRTGVAPLAISDIAVGDAPPTDLANGVVAPVRFLFANPYARLALDSVAVAVEVLPGRAAWTLRSARLLDGAVRPGSTARVACELERWRGARETRIITVDVPEELPDGRYTLWIGGGAERSRGEAQRLPGRYRPISLDDAWSRLARTRASDALYSVVLAQAPEVTTGGRDYPELPASALPLLASSRQGGDQARRGEQAALGEQRFPLDGQLRGEIVVPLEVDSRSP